MPRLENWTVQEASDYMGKYRRLLGHVYEDDRFLDGHFIHTSEIMMIDEEKGIAKTMNTEYKLGAKRL